MDSQIDVENVLTILTQSPLIEDQWSYPKLGQQFLSGVLQSSFYDDSPDLLKVSRKNDERIINIYGSVNTQNRE